MIEDWLYTRLTGAGVPVYPVEAPPKTDPPYIVYKQVSGSIRPDDSSTTIASSRWQIDSYPADYRAGKLLVGTIMSQFTPGFVDGQCVYTLEWEGPTDIFNPRVERHYQSTDLLLQIEA